MTEFLLGWTIPLRQRDKQTLRESVFCENVLRDRCMLGSTQSVTLTRPLKDSDSTWQVKMFRGQGERRGAGPRRTPTAGRLSASNQKQGQRLVRRSNAFACWWFGTGFLQLNLEEPENWTAKTLNYLIMAHQVCGSVAVSVTGWVCNCSGCKWVSRWNPDW